MAENIHPKLKQVLTEIKFIDRLQALSDTYPRNNPILSPDINIVSEKVKSLGYNCSYNKKHKFFKIAKEKDVSSSIHLAIERGKVEFILNIGIDGEPMGGTYGVLTYRVGAPERIKSPFFSEYDQLDEILKEGFAVYEDIKSGLSKESA